MTGTVYAVTTVHAAAEAFEKDVPFQLAIIEIDEGGRTMARIVGPPVRIGDAVSALAETNGVWYFRLIEGSSTEAE